MSQALHTASTGINAGQSQINVIAHNVANINTTAYKAANLTFETLYSNNLSYGSAATKDGGGTNPKQIGLGVKVGGITRNFTSGTFVSTGRDMDCMISGSGFFVVEDGDGESYFTRDGVFSLDSEGNLVTQNGMKVIAAKSAYSNASSSETVKIPKNMRAVVEGDANIASKTLGELNNASITGGDIVVKINKDATTVQEVTLHIGRTGVKNSDLTVQNIIDDFNSQIRTQLGIATGGTSPCEFSAANGSISYTAGSIDSFVADGTTSNFIGETGLTVSKNTSNHLNETVELQDMVNYNDTDAISLINTSIDANGIVMATYQDGSILTQFIDDAQTIQWKYTTPAGVSITGADVAPVGSAITNSSFVLELATMVNEEGLVSINNNLWQLGANVGEIYYGVAGEMSFGTIETGGYEGSNVDIATELSNMISAQRMIQMNSRVFSTASSVMETLSYLGQ